MLSRMRVPTRWWPREKSWQPLNFSVYLRGRRRGTWNKIYSEDVPQTQVAKSAFYIKLVFEWVDVSKLSQIWVKIGPKLRKIEKSQMIFVKIWLIDDGLVCEWVIFFFNSCMFGFIFKFQWLIPTKTCKLKYPGRWT